MANAGGRTAEELADEKTMKVQEDMVKTEDSYDSEDPDIGLPPPIPATKTRFIPKLSIGGLGLSTVSNI